MGVPIAGRRSLDLGGGVRVTAHTTATWRTDAAPLLGPVPKVLWSRAVGDEVDADERVPMAAIALLVETPEVRLVVDPGPGRAARSEAPTLVDLVASGLDALEDELAGSPPDAFVLTNLRAEHVGALADLRRLPALAGLPVLAQADEWAGAGRDNARTALVVDQPGVAEILAAGEARQLPAETEPFPGIEARLVPGVSVGHQVVVVRGRGANARTLGWFGDLLPRRWSGNPRWITAFDDLPLGSVAAKADLFARAAAEEWIVIPAHEPGPLVARLVPERDRFTLVPLEQGLTG